MIIKCSKCPAKFKIHEDKIKSTGFSFKCTKCGQVNVVKKPSAPTKKEVLRLKTKLSFKDMVASQIFFQYLSPFFWFFVVIFLWVSYNNAFPHFHDDLLLFFIAIAYNIILMFCILLLVAFFMIVIGTILRRMKGIAGEHEFIFGREGFIERTAFNENKYQYVKQMRFYETGRYYLLFPTVMHAYMFPKRFLSRESEATLKALLKPFAPVKRRVTHIVVTILFVAAVLFNAVAFQMIKYTLMTTPFPAQAAWTTDVLYVFAGKSVVGEKMSFLTFIGFDNPEGYGGEAFKPYQERFLWIIKDGQIEKHPISQQGINSVVVYRNKVYAPGFNVEKMKEALYVWNGNAFVEDADQTLEEFSTDFFENYQDSEKVKDPPYINIYEWDTRVGKGEALSLTLGGKQFELFMNIEQLDEFGNQDLTISGKWVDSMRNLQELYSVNVGSSRVTGETYREIFGPK